MENYDVVIIGAGLAGLYCANRLCFHKRVLMLGNRPIASRKPCGGLLTAEAAARIETLRLPGSFYCAEDPLAMEVEAGGRTSQAVFSNVRRGLLESEIYNGCASLADFRIASGLAIVAMRGGTFLLGLGSGEEVLARCLVVADGVGSATRSRLGYGKAPSIILEQLLFDDALGGARMVVDGSVSRDYYYWMIPKDGKTLLGYKLEDRERVLDDIGRRLGIDLRAMRHASERYPVTRLTDLRQVELGRGNLLFIGEAAGLVMPRSGEGIGSALLSAELAAEAILGGSRNKARCYRKSMLPRLARIEGDLRLGQRPGR